MVVVQDLETLATLSLINAEIMGKPDADPKPRKAGYIVRPCGQFVCKAEDKSISFIGLAEESRRCKSSVLLEAGIVAKRPSGKGSAASPLTVLNGKSP